MRAAATVVTIASVCRSVIESVTVIEMMLSEVAVRPSSSPAQRSSRSCCSAVVRLGSPP